MKKVWTILFLVAAMLLAGCRSTSASRSANAQGAVAAPQRSYFWDKDLRPAQTAPAKPAEVQRAEKPKPAVETAQPALTLTKPPAPMKTTLADAKTAPAAKIAAADAKTVPAEVKAAPARDTKDTTAGKETAKEAKTMKPTEPVRKAQMPVSQPDVITTSIEEAQPAMTDLEPPAGLYEKTTPFGPGLVSVDDMGGRTLSIVYPRQDYGIVQIDKTMPNEVRLNQPFTYTLRVTNLTETMLTDVSITETLSKEFSFKGAEPSPKTEDNKLLWEIDSLGPKASKDIKITGVASGTKQLEHCTAITHTIRDCAVVQVVEPTLELVKVVPAEALLCEPIAVEFVVTNTGTGAAQNVEITDTLPAGMQTADGKDKVSLDAGTLAAGESRRFSVKLRATKTGAYINKAVATSATGLRVESEATLLTVRQPVLTISKSGPQRQYLGRPVSYEITIVNKGDGPARNTTVEDVIPPSVAGVEATPGAQFSTSKLIWEIGTLEPNGSKKVRVSYVPTREGEVMATASATAYCAETVTDSAKTIVTGIAATRIEVVDLEDPVEIGGTTTYVITASNQGSASDRNIRIACTLDDKMQYVSSAGATAGSLMGKTVSFAPLNTLEPKAKAIWRIVVRGTRPGDALLKTILHTDALTLPVEENEATHIYQPSANGK
jgi:uncharacterized repeat protein (TIGR01451 family)